MRLIREFMAALQLLLEGKDLEHRREELKKLYEQYIISAPMSFITTPR